MRNCEEAVLGGVWQPDRMLAALQLGYITHMAYDAPYKTSAAAVLQKGRELRKEAGLCTNMARSTHSFALGLLTEGLPQYSRRPWEHLELQAPAQVGLLWLPGVQQAVLGRAAGRRAREIIEAAWKKAWRRTAQTSPLLEITLWLLHKACERRFPEDPSAAVARMKQSLARVRRGRGMETLKALYDSLLF